MVKSCNKLFNYYNFAGTTFEDSDYLSMSINNDNQEHMATYDNQELKAFWIATDTQKYPIHEKSSRLFSKISVQQIIDCCSKDENGKTKLQIKDKEAKEYRNVSFKDFAVLARTSTEMKYIENALKQVYPEANDQEKLQLRKLFNISSDKNKFVGEDDLAFFGNLQNVGAKDINADGVIDFKDAQIIESYVIAMKQEIARRSENMDAIAKALGYTPTEAQMNEAKKALGV